MSTGFLDLCNVCAFGGRFLSSKSNPERQAATGGPKRDLESVGAHFCQLLTLTLGTFALILSLLGLRLGRFGRGLGTTKHTKLLPWTIGPIMGFLGMEPSRLALNRRFYRVKMCMESSIALRSAAERSTVAFLRPGGTAGAWSGHEKLIL